ncbi:methylated-DNA--[protein]-cysteine S-methyltransferase [Streptomyces aidingensis]|uniref:Methylated-DNA--protein-cysteine methyltransferase n=1 Tax=Streptomyces aidingensis TaxID=910347 RepID=A0A1I1IR93_9ACTN|nr:methylated-DNA--[protein]-cysteine S-methyltransferase [Streptomyces aidingensis]SFC38745.1 methylated-DNA-[protein]-cysteine S-methyltransferase [Streptomyces aidingensis]
MTTPLRYTTHPSPLGELLLAGPEPGVLAGVWFTGQRYAPHVRPDWRRDAAAFRTAAGRLDAYFAGELKEFGLPSAATGTDFQRRVWAALDTIPYGSTVSYARLAVMAGLPARAARAVGGAVGRNPLTVVRPCHRVIGTGGALTGYAGGTERKRRLLTLEGVLRPSGG